MARHNSNTFGFTSTFGGDLILNPISLIRTIFIISFDNVASFDIASFFDILTSIVTARAAVATVFFHPNSACLEIVLIVSLWFNWMNISFTSQHFSTFCLRTSPTITVSGRPPSVPLGPPHHWQSFTKAATIRF